MDGGSRVYGGSDHISALLEDNHHHNTLSRSSDPIDCLWLPSPSPSFHESMVNFDDIHGRGISSSPDIQNPIFRPRCREEASEEDLEISFHHPEKKRRLTTEQVQYLERSFEVDNKLEPERKVQLAKELGLQPRQVAIWFQNRRARFKTKQLEKDYDLLKASYDNLKADYDSLLKEKEKLKNEVCMLTNKLKLKESQIEAVSDPGSPVESNHSEPQDPAVNVGKHEESTVVCKLEDASSAKSDVFDSESPLCTEQQSDFSQDGEDPYLMSTSLYNFPKLEDPHGNCGSFGVAVEDSCFWSWINQN